MGGAAPVVGLGLQAAGLFAGGGSAPTQKVSGLDPDASLEVSKERFEFEKELFQRRQDIQLQMLRDVNVFANQTFTQELELINAQRDEANRQLFRNFQQLQRNLDLDLARINMQGLQSQFAQDIEEQFGLASASVNAFNELVFAKGEAELQAFDAETRRNLVDELISLRNFELESSQGLETERLLTGQAGERGRLSAGRASQVEQFLDTLAANEEERAAIRTLFASQGQDINRTLAGRAQEIKAIDRILGKYNFARNQFGVQEGALLSQQGFDRAALSGVQGLQSLDQAFQNYTDVYNAESQYQQQLQGIQQNVQNRTAGALQNLQGALLQNQLGRQERDINQFDLQRQAIDAMLAKNIGFTDFATGQRDIDIQFARNILAAQAANLAGQAGNTQEAIAAQAQNRAATLASLSNIVASGGQPIGQSGGGGGLGSTLAGLGGLAKSAAAVFSQPSFNIPSSQTTSPFSLFEGQTKFTPDTVFAQPAFNNQGAIQASGINNLFRSNPVQSVSFQPVSTFSSFPTTGQGNFSFDPNTTFTGGF